MSRWTGSQDGSRSANRGPRRGVAAGFTLLEVIVALAILAVALAALMQSFSTGLRGARAAERQTIATLLAESRLAAVGVEMPLEAGESGGEIDHGYRWRATVRPYLEPGLEAEGQAGMAAYEIAVTVSWEAADGGGSVTLETLRLAPRRR